jgi:hypothetical protein
VESVNNPQHVSYHWIFQGRDRRTVRHGKYDRTGQEPDCGPNCVAWRTMIRHAGGVNRHGEPGEIPQFPGKELIARAAELLAGFEAASVTAMLHAACSSPTARQSMVSCAALLQSCWMNPPAGSRIATAENLPPLVEALRAASPQLATVEDWLPLDPREAVFFRARSGEEAWGFRVHPGGLESPLQSLQAVLNYAEALDSVLVARFGFSIADMLELTGRMLGTELSVLAPVWADWQVSMDSPPAVTEAEVAVAASYLEAWWSGDRPGAELVGEDSPRRERLELAAEGLTVDAQDLSFDAGPDRALFGPLLFVRNPAGVLPVPSGLIIESLTAAVAAVLRGLPPSAGAESKLADSEPVAGGSADTPDITGVEVAAAARRWQSRTVSDLAWACRGIPATILFGELADDGHELLLIAPGHRHVVAVELVSGLVEPEIAQGIRAARDRLAEFGPGSRFRVSPPPAEASGAGLGRTEADSQPPEGTTGAGLAWFSGTADAVPFAASLLKGEPAALAEGTMVTRLVVVEGPWRPEPTWIPGIPACTLDEFRALLAAHDWRSTDREELWSFLDELTSLGADNAGNGFAELNCWSILDAWDAWQANGMLCPAWVPPGTYGRIPPRELEYAWERDAALDSFDALLVSLGMGGAREWSELIPTPVPAVQPDSDQQSFVVTVSLYQPRKVWWVCPDMALIVGADLEFREDLTFSRAAVGILANTIEDTLLEVARTSPRAWAIWRQVHRDTPVMIQLTPGRLPEHMPALRFVSLGSRFSELYADPQRLALLQPSQVHSLIGEALAFSLLARMQAEVTPHGPRTDEDDNDDSARVLELDPSGEDLERAETFRAAWESIRPRFTQRPKSTPFPPHALTPPQTLTEEGEARARRTIARRLAGSLAAGSHPLRVVLEQLCPEALDALSDAAQRFTGRAALAAACGELERALGDRFASRASLEVNLESPWAEETLTDLDMEAYDNEAERSRVAELLTERLLYRPPGGSLVPDRRDVHHLLDLAAAALHASLEAQYAFAAIRPAGLEISELGDVEIVPTGPPRADTRAWRLAEFRAGANAFTVANDESSGEGEQPREGDSIPGHEEGDQPGSLRSILEDQAREGTTYRALNAQGLLKVDDQLRENCGFTLDSIRAVLATVTSWEVPGEPYPPIAQVRRADLVDDVATWSGIPREEVEAAVDACTLTGARIQEEGFRYWQLEQRGARLALRPLIEPPGSAAADELWLLPRCAHKTQNVLLAYLNDHRLPWPNPDLPKPVRTAARAWSRIAEESLENELANAAQTAGLAYRNNLTKDKAAPEGVKMEGEVDLIAADLARHRIWVAEAKYLPHTFSPLEMAFHIANFHGPRALAIGPGTNEFRQFRSARFRPYLERVRANVDAVRCNISGALRLITDGRSNLNPNATDLDNESWQVIGIIVTAHTEIAAFVPDPGLPIVAIDQLKEMLLADDIPPPGWWDPTEDGPA